MRDDFLKPTKEVLKKRAAFICSNPSCKIMTIAPSVESDEKIQYIGIAAHITAASVGGPRYDENMTIVERQSASNGIFLCCNCAEMIDKNNGIDYEVTKLKEWKENHEEWVLDNLNKRLSAKSPTINTTSSNQLGGITAGVINVSKLDLNQTDKKAEHDISIFQNSDIILNEDILEVILQSLLGDESLWSDKLDKLEQFKWFFEKSSNEYLSEKIQTHLIKLRDSLKQLLSFISKQFDMFPHNQKTVDGFRMCMRPELNVDRKGIGLPHEHNEHTKLFSELLKIATNFEDNYKEYRRSIKRELYV